MAEDPKIVPSPPPAEPRDVQVVPSPPPAEPFDVPTYPSPPPAEPFDVKVYPDPPPGGTHDVPINPDPGPAAPFDVPTSPDAPPAEPFDVPTTPDPAPAVPFDVPVLPDGPPAEPFDVPTAPDGPPLEPFDVPTAPDGPPAVPFDVPTEPSAPPGLPFDVGVTPDGPPAEPFNVGVDLSPPPREPFDVPTFPSPPALFTEGSGGGSPSIFAIVEAVRSFDARVGNFLSSLLDLSPINASMTGAGALDPLTLARWFQDYLNTVGPAGVAKFAAQQAILYAMNPVVAKVFDPLYFVKMLIPGSMGNFHTTIDTQAGLTMENVVRAKDQLFQSTGGFEKFDTGFGPNVYDGRSGHTFNAGQDFSVDEMVDAALNGEAHAFTSPVQDQRGVPAVQKFDAQKYFQDRDSFGTQLATNRAKSLPADVQSSPLAASAFINGVVRMSVPGEIDGAIYSETQDPSVGVGHVDDDDARIPLCFTDLRKDPVMNAYRSVYFRPLNLGFNKSVTPEWSEGGAFGRVDPIVSYQRTSRTYSVNFELHAFAPEDLGVMYNKMVWLDSMCYPSFGSDSLIRSGPVVRMRIGDAVATESGGLTGIIKSLGFDFNDALWELKKGFKVPRSFKVAVEFLALHEGPVGILNGQFGVFKLPTGGPQGEVDTSNPGGPTESQEGPTRVAVLQPGRFAKFGEPRK